MGDVAQETGFIVWGIDQTAYGPVELPTLVSWVKDARVTADTWVYVLKDDCWQKAPDIPELQMFFRAKPSVGVAGAEAGETASGVDIRALRRVKILANMTDERLR